MIDELFGIQQGSVKLPADKFSTQSSGESSGEIKQIPLSSSEELYSEIRTLNFNAVGPTLSRKARNISAQFQERHEAKTVREMKEFVEKLPLMQVIMLFLSKLREY